MKQTGKGFQTDRRSFIKASGLAAVSTMLVTEASPAGSQPAPNVNHAPDPAGPSSLADMVNVLQGTDSTFEFSRGNTLPIAAMPFGMAHWTMQSYVDTPWMFHPEARRIQGFRCTHQLSPWLDDYGFATILPFRGNIRLDASSRSSSYRPEDARLTPYSLRLELMRYGSQVELVPTERCAILRATFDDSDSSNPGLLFDIVDEGNNFESDPNSLTLRMKTKANAGGVPDNFAAYYVVKFAAPHLGLEVKQDGKHQIGVVRFRAGNSIEARIGTSFISFDQAEVNLEREVGKASIETLRERGARTWNEQLGVISIEGGSNDQQRTFYSCLYRALLFPRMWHELDAQGEMRHFSAFNGRVMPGPMYADHGYWDLYRVWYPMMSVLFPERLGQILQGWVNAYQEGGWLPQFPCPGYRACMTGSLIDAVFGDAAVKGIAGFNLAAAFEGMKKHATQPGDPAKGYGRRGLEFYLRDHYVPENHVEQSVAETVDAAYGDFCIAQVAKVLGKSQDAATFLERSQYWRNLFDPQVKFLRGKNEDGSWVSPFNPFTWGSPYVEGAAWQHRWDAPHDPHQLFEGMGGDAAAAGFLHEMLTIPPTFHVGVYGMEIHEMSEMAAVRFGQYAHSNQPVHHVLYLFAHAGRPDQTQYWARKVMAELYSPDNFPGDEDTGSMSAWFIMSALGFFPACPGKPEYTLGSPLFSRAIVRLGGNKTLTIEAPGNSEQTVYVRNLSLNGQALSGPTVDHKTLMQGGTMRFAMASTR
ncbi:MAG TPA: GH92 family glycosyl hydrolase [Terracidiphilus sp.]|nr:GH92 family glycosyl hydrolase [Terracidiphilus sp.]